MYVARVHSLHVADPRVRKPQERKAALPVAPSYSLDPEERRQRSKRDIVEGRKKKDEPADKVGHSSLGRAEHVRQARVCTNMPYRVRS